MKYVKSLTATEKIPLSKLLKNHHTRAHMSANEVLLSNKCFKLNNIASIFEVDRHKVSHWLSK